EEGLVVIGEMFWDVLHEMVDYASLATRPFHKGGQSTPASIYESKTIIRGHWCNSDFHGTLGLNIQQPISWRLPKLPLSGFFITLFDEGTLSLYLDRGIYGFHMRPELVIGPRSRHYQALADYACAREGKIGRASCRERV